MKLSHLINKLNLNNYVNVSLAIFFCNLTYGHGFIHNWIYSMKDKHLKDLETAQKHSTWKLTGATRKT